MLAAVISLSLLGAGLGLALGFASRKFAVEGNPLVDELVAMMPGSNCGQCGFPGWSARRFSCGRSGWPSPRSRSTSGCCGKWEPSRPAATAPAEPAPLPMPVSVRTRLATAKARWKTLCSTAPVL